MKPLAPDHRHCLCSVERLQAALLGRRFGVVNEARRDKYLMNEAVKEAGLESTRQIKTGDWSQVRQFLSTLTSPPVPGGPNGERENFSVENSKNVPGSGDGPTSPGDHREEVDAERVDGDLDNVLSIVKPSRGCASGNVFLCKGEREAEEAFLKILGTPKYGTPGAVNDEVRVILPLFFLRQTQ